MSLRAVQLCILLCVGLAAVRGQECPTLQSFLESNDHDWLLSALPEDVGAFTLLLPTKVGNISSANVQNFIARNLMLTEAFPTAGDLLGAAEAATLASTTVSFTEGSEGDLAAEFQALGGKATLVAPVGFPIGQGVVYLITPLQSTDASDAGADLDLEALPGLNLATTTPSCPNGSNGICIMNYNCNGALVNGAPVVTPGCEKRYCKLKSGQDADSVNWYEVQERGTCATR